MQNKKQSKSCYINNITYFKQAILVATILTASMVLTTSKQASAQNKPKGTKTVKVPTCKVEYLYQANGGFTVYFSDGTYARRAGEYTEIELKNAFKGMKKQGKWTYRMDAIIEDNTELVSFKMEDGETDPSWVIINCERIKK